MVGRQLLPTVATVALWTLGAYSPAAETPPAVTNSLGMRMVLVPAGSFVMGSPPGAPLRQAEETTRRVTLTRAFRISATEVTQKQWLVLMPNRSPQVGDDLPVTSVTWTEGQEFCQKVSRKEGVLYRLPTEAEWEYACRAGSAVLAVAGPDLGDVAWYADNSEGTTHAVGQKRPNPWGLHDVLGNVAEWTLDVYEAYPSREEEKDPKGPVTGTKRVVRGGSWRGFPPALRCAARTGNPESYQLPHVGLRVVQEVE